MIVVRLGEAGPKLRCMILVDGQTALPAYQIFVDAIELDSPSGGELLRGHCI
jgi:hypothetical protein